MKAKKRSHNAQTLSAKWLKDPIKSKYISGSEGDKKFTCLICQKTLSCESAYDHVSWHQSQGSCQETPNQSKIEEYSQKNMQRQTYEFKLAKFISCHNLSFSLIEPLTSFMKELSVDEIIRQSNFSSIDRTRARVIVNEGISMSIKSQLETKMDTSYYHLIIDEVSDRFGNGYLGISIRYLDTDLSPRTRFYRLIKLKTDCTGEELHKILDETVLFSRIRENNLISIITDGAPAMAAENKGVATRIASSVKHLFWLHCTCHCFNLIIDKASSTCISNIITLVKEISATFAFSNIDHAALHEIQREEDSPEKKILRFVPTRWLSLDTCVERILEQWDYLRKFFEAQNTKDKNFYVSKMFSDPLSKPKLEFVSYVLKKMSIANKNFQDETKITSYALYDHLRSLFLSFFKMILKPEFRKDKNFTFEKAYAIDLENNMVISEYFMSPAQCYESFKKREVQRRDQLE